MSSKEIEQLLVLGGGAAGWLTAALLAAEHGVRQGGHCRITLVEAPGIPTIGVGEGTWPSMRDTLRRIGLPEITLFSHCDASFKQGSQFIGWRDGAGGDSYYHPFSLPHGYFQMDLGPYCQGRDYAYGVSAQAAACDAGRAPKQLATPEYAGVLNYGYHFDAGKFGECLREHCVQQLGVGHVQAEVIAVEADSGGFITGLKTVAGDTLAADFFVDCSGSASRLIGEHYQVPWISQAQVLFNDRAIATQLPYANSQAPIASVTKACAHANGWVWDIALPTRCGIGFVYSSAHQTESAAESAFRQFLQTRATSAGLDAERIVPDLTLRKLKFEPGHREIFWTHNCVAVGMSAGFIEPLEASALALVEQSAAAIRDFLPVHKSGLRAAANQFNTRFQQHWQSIVEFLKLHYVLSKRTGRYWSDHRDQASVPESLAEHLALWRDRAPMGRDIADAQPLFPAASYRFVLQGMQAECSYLRSPRADHNTAMAGQLLNDVAQQTRRCLDGLPDNRALIDAWLAGTGAH